MRMQYVWISIENHFDPIERNSNWILYFGFLSNQTFSRNSRLEQSKDQWEFWIKGFSGFQISILIFRLTFFVSKLTLKCFVLWFDIFMSEQFNIYIILWFTTFYVLIPMNGNFSILNGFNFIGGNFLEVFFTF